MKKIVSLLFVSLFAALPLFADEEPVPPTEEPKEQTEQLISTNEIAEETPTVVSEEVKEKAVSEEDTAEDAE